jgi:hypothetical protein
MSGEDADVFIIDNDTSLAPEYVRKTISVGSNTFSIVRSADRVPNTSGIGVIKRSETGEVVGEWFIEGTKGSNFYFSDIVSDNNGNVYVCGFAQLGSYTFGGIEAPVDNVASRVFLIKLSAEDCTIRRYPNQDPWIAWLYDCTGDPRIAADSTYVYLTGHKNMEIVRYNADGTNKMTKAHSNTYDVTATAIGIRVNGGVSVSAFTSGAQNGINQFSWHDNVDNPNIIDITPTVEANRSAAFILSFNSNLILNNVYTFVSDGQIDMGTKIHDMVVSGDGWKVYVVGSVAGMHMFINGVSHAILQDIPVMNRVTEWMAYIDFDSENTVFSAKLEYPDKHTHGSRIAVVSENIVSTASIVSASPNAIIKRYDAPESFQWGNEKYIQRIKVHNFMNNAYTSYMYVLPTVDTSIQANANAQDAVWGLLFNADKLIVSGQTSLQNPVFFGKTLTKEVGPGGYILRAVPDIHAPPIVTASARMVNNVPSFLDATVIPTGDLEEVGFEYRVSGSDEWTKVDLEVKYSFTYTLSIRDILDSILESGVDSAMLHEARAFAKSVGSEVFVYSSTVHLGILAAPPATAVTNLKAVNINESVIVLAWDESVNPLTTYEYQKTHRKNFHGVAWTSTGTANRAVVRGLKIYKRYNFNVRPVTNGMPGNATRISIVKTRKRPILSSSFKRN